MDRAQSCCFTGHRPNKLPWGVHEDDPRCLALKARLDEAVAAAYEKGYRHFLCGMARGSDFYFCEAVLALKARRGDVVLEGAVPCQEQAERWNEGEQARYQSLLSQCDLETLVQHHYDSGCMRRRNRYMVDRASLMIAVYDGMSGGTMTTLNYAMNQSLDVVMLDVSGETPRVITAEAPRG